MAYVPAASGRQFKLKYKWNAAQEQQAGDQTMREGEAVGTGDQSPRQASRYTPLASAPLLRHDDGGRRGGAAVSRVAIYLGGKQKERCALWSVGGLAAGIEVVVHFGAGQTWLKKMTNICYLIRYQQNCEISDFGEVLPKFAAQYRTAHHVHKLEKHRGLSISTLMLKRNDDFVLVFFNFVILSLRFQN
jgi:hypothetical protein